MGVVGVGVVRMVVGVGVEKSRTGARVGVEQDKSSGVKRKPNM